MKRSLGLLWLVIVLPLTGCGRFAPPGPSPSPDLPVASASRPVIVEPFPTGAGLDAFARTSWTAIDPQTGDWIIGRGASAYWLLKLGEGNARADWGSVAFVRVKGDAVSVGLATAESPSAGEVAIPFKTRTTKATVDRNAAHLFVHGGANGLDEGIVAIEIAPGEVTAVISPGPVAPDEERNFLLWSPTGNTLFSTICNQERCLVDVIDATSLSARRLAQPFPTVAGTDSYLLGHAHSGWSVLDLASGATLPAAIDPSWTPRAILAVDDTHILLDYQDADGHGVALVDLVAGTTRSVFASADPSLRLMRLPVVDGRWAFLGPDGSFADGLARDGKYPRVAVLDIHSGNVDPQRIAVSSSDLRPEPAP